MLVKLVKEKVKYKTKLGEEKEIYNFRLLLENGNTIAIAPLSWVDKQNNRNSTYKELSMIAEEIAK